MVNERIYRARTFCVAAMPPPDPGDLFTGAGVETPCHMVNHLNPWWQLLEVPCSGESSCVPVFREALIVF